LPPGLQADDLRAFLFLSYVPFVWSISKPSTIIVNQLHEAWLGRRCAERHLPNRIHKSCHHFQYHLCYTATTEPGESSTTNTVTATPSYSNNPSNVLTSHHPHHTGTCSHNSRRVAVRRRLADAKRKRALAAEHFGSNWGIDRLVLFWKSEPHATLSSQSLQTPLPNTHTPFWPRCFALSHPPWYGCSGTPSSRLAFLVATSGMSQKTQTVPVLFSSFTLFCISRETRIPLTAFCTWPPIHITRRALGATKTPSMCHFSEYHFVWFNFPARLQLSRALMYCVDFAHHVDDVSQETTPEVDARMQLK
jgi:hypothetical protein